MKRSQRIMWPIALALTVALGIYVFIMYQSQSASIFADAPVGISAVAGAFVTATPPSAGYVEYRNERYDFSFYYSPEGTIQEYDEGEGAMTVVLEDAKSVQGLQVFIVPYAAEAITEKRFKADVPSGVRNDVEKTTLDGIEAVTFTSVDQFLGDTREVWFIKGGYLYEITTLKSEEEWFRPVIQSWRFV